MAQHDYVIANGTGAAVRSDLNNALAAIVSQNSGATAPATTYAYQFWADTTTNLLKLRNSANSAWITLFQLDGEWSTLPVENGTAAAPSIYFKDSGTDTGFYSPGTDQVGISTAGTSRLTIDANGNLAVDTNSLYVDAANNRVGIGTSSPQKKTHFAISSGTGLLSNYDGLLLENQTSAIGSTVGIGFGFGGLTNGTTAGITAIQAETTQTATHLAFFTRHDASGGLTAEKMRIDSSGRVGIGNTAPGNFVGNVNLVVGSAATSTTNAGVTLYSGTATYGGVYFADGTVGDQLYRGAVEYKHDVDALALYSGGSEKARIDSSGRLLVGTSSALTGGDTQYSKLVLQGNSAGATGPAFLAIARGETAATTASAGQTIGRIVFSDSAAGQYASIGCVTDAAVGNNDYPSRLEFSTTADGASSPTERMRIDNRGKITVWGTNENLEIEKSGQGNRYLIFGKSTADGSGYTYQIFRHGASDVGTITYNGSGTSYNTSSDYRLKENIVDLDTATERLLQLKPYRFNFISNPDQTVDGFIAHEVQDVVPEAIHGTKDAIDDDGKPIYQGIDQSKLVPLLTAALQEAIAKIESLEARLTALESA